MMSSICWLLPRSGSDRGNALFCIGNIKKHETECVQILGKDDRSDTAGIIGRTYTDLLHWVSRRRFALDTYRAIF